MVKVSTIAAVVAASCWLLQFAVQRLMPAPDLPVRPHVQQISAPSSGSAGPTWRDRGQPHKANATPPPTPRMIAGAGN